MKLIVFLTVYCIINMILSSVWMFIEFIIDGKLTPTKVDTIMAVLISFFITKIIIFYEDKLNNYKEENNQ